MEKAAFSVDDFKIASDKKEAKLLRLIEASKEALIDNEIDTLLRTAIIAVVQAEIERNKDLNK